MSQNALIAIGGNSLIKAGERGTIEEQSANATTTARNIVRLVEKGWQLVLTHGNGPQVGAALLRSERSANEVYTLPLDVCVASTQSEIGYLLQRSLHVELGRAGLHIPVATVLTQVRVLRDDPAFQNPTKPIGPFFSKTAAEEKEQTLGWKMVEDASRGYRRVVPSPEPVEVLENRQIAILLSNGVIVIALGGGGIPVVSCDHHWIVGVEAVIDKDQASALLAAELGMELMVISTDVEFVYLNYKKSGQRALERVSVAQMQTYLDEGHFPPGSMGPKVQSAIRFLHNGGKEVIITSSDRILEAVEGRCGTHITP
jgi:carbamate kinase